MSSSCSTRMRSPFLYALGARMGPSRRQKDKPVRADTVRFLLLVGTETAERRMVAATAARAGWSTLGAPTIADAQELLGGPSGQEIRAVLVGQWNPASGPALVRALRADRPGLPILVLAEGGSVGQVIVFGRDFDTKVVMWRGDGPNGWAKWLAGFVDDLENGEGFELGAANDSEGSEDSVGYESYFYDGNGRGQGDGGGDSGAGGIRLTGEYRGWNVLEAWADRSVRKWQQAGIIPTPETQSVTPTRPAKVRISSIFMVTFDLDSI